MFAVVVLQAAALALTLHPTHRVEAAAVVAVVVVITADLVDPVEVTQ